MLNLVENPVSHIRTKIVEVHYHFIREKFLQDVVKILYVNTNDQVVNLFTKSLSTKKFEAFY